MRSVYALRNRMQNKGDMRILWPRHEWNAFEHSLFSTSCYNSGIITEICYVCSFTRLVLHCSHWTSLATKLCNYSVDGSLSFEHTVSHSSKSESAKNCCILVIIPINFFKAKKHGHRTSLPLYLCEVKQWSFISTENAPTAQQSAITLPL